MLRNTLLIITNNAWCLCMSPSERELMWVEPTRRHNLSWTYERSRSHNADYQVKRTEWFSMLFNSQEASSTYGISEVFWDLFITHQELFFSEPCDCESWNKLTVVVFPDRCNVKWSTASVKHVWSLHLGTQSSYLRYTIIEFPTCSQKDHPSAHSLGASGNRFLISPWPAPGIHWSHGKIRRGYSPRRRSSCSHCVDGSHLRQSSTCVRGSIGWYTPSHMCQGAWRGSPRIGRRDRWGLGRHTPHQRLSDELKY